MKVGEGGCVLISLNFEAVMKVGEGGLCVNIS